MRAAVQKPAARSAARAASDPLQFLMQMTAIVLLAVSVGISIFNTIALTHLAKSVTFAVYSANEKVLGAAVANQEGDPMQLLRDAEALMERAEILLETEADIDEPREPTARETPESPRQ